MQDRHFLGILRIYYFMEFNIPSRERPLGDHYVGDGCRRDYIPLFLPWEYWIEANISRERSGHNEFIRRFGLTYIPYLFLKTYQSRKRIRRMLSFEHLNRSPTVERLVSGQLNFQDIRYVNSLIRLDYERQIVISGSPSDDSTIGSNNFDLQPYTSEEVTERRIGLIISAPRGHLFMCISFLYPDIATRIPDSPHLHFDSFSLDRWNHTVLVKDYNTFRYVVDTFERNSSIEIYR